MGCFHLPCRTHRVTFMFVSHRRHPAAVLAKGGTTGFQPAKTWRWLSLSSFSFALFVYPICTAGSSWNDSVLLLLLLFLAAAAYPGAGGVLVPPQLVAICTNQLLSLPTHIL